MKLPSEILTMADQIQYPVFLVQDGMIIHANLAATQRMIPVNVSVNELISAGQDDYADFTNGRLLLTLVVNCAQYNASVIKAEGYDVFCLDLKQKDPGLQALALAAQKLREPLATALLEVQLLIDEDTKKKRSIESKTQQLIKSLFEMFRTVDNMSDAVEYQLCADSRYEIRDINAMVSEITEKAGNLLEDLNVQVTYQGLDHSARCLIDTERLEKGILNMLSNAVKNSPQGSTVRVSLRQGVGKLYLSVQNGGNGKNTDISQSLNSFLREPGLEDNRLGVGLGIPIIRGAAAIHNGTVLIDQPENEGLRFTMSISQEMRQPPLLRSPVNVPIDKAGGFDKMLKDLADILPPKAFL